MGAVVSAAVCFTSAPALAFDYSADVKITGIEASYMPAFVKFTADRQVGLCAAGSEITWHARGASDANANAVLSLLLSAKLSNSSVRLFGSNGSCEMDFIWIV